ncbi:MAG: hypothetical protein WBR09_12980, partial [Serratia proteamaculans]
SNLKPTNQHIKPKIHHHTCQTQHNKLQTNFSFWLLQMFSLRIIHLATLKTTHKHTNETLSFLTG